MISREKIAELRGQYPIQPGGMRYGKKTLATIHILLDEIEAQRDRMALIRKRLVMDLPHGDTNHQLWLIGAITAIFRGEPIRPVAGKRTSEVLQEEINVLQKENARLDGLINSPEILDFQKAIQLESAHQRERWGIEHDGGKTDADWFWLIGYLAGKALHNPGGELDKQLHRIITVGAAACNWHAAKLGKTNMRPGTDVDEKNGALLPRREGK